MATERKVGREARIVAVSYWLPETILDNQDLSEEFPEWNVEKIADKTGIHKRHIADPGVTSGDLAFRAGERLIAEYSLDRDTIDFVLFCTQSPDYILPTTACLLQQRLGIPRTAGALDFSLGCSGYVYGLSLAKGLIAAGSARNVLLLTADTYTHFLHPEDKSCRTLFGDGASASLISSASEGWTIGDFVFGTDGSGAEHLIVENGGAKNRSGAGDEVRTSDGGFQKSPDYLYMNGPEVFRFTANTVPPLVREVMARNGMNMESVDLFIFHQANQYMLDVVRKRSGIPQDKFFYSLANTGNTVSSTIPIALKEAWSGGRIDFDCKLLLAGFGVGYSWAGCTLG